jgi:hypothetical protein
LQTDPLTQRRVCENKWPTPKGTGKREENVLGTVAGTEGCAAWISEEIREMGKGQAAEENTAA